MMMEGHIRYVCHRLELSICEEYVGGGMADSVENIEEAACFTQA